MGLSVGELIKKLKKYDKNKKVRILLGMGNRILWLSHEDIDFDLENGCVLITDTNIEEMIYDKSIIIDTVEDLLFHLNYFDNDLLVWNYDMYSALSPIMKVSDEIRDENRILINDTVFLISFTHMVG